MSEIKKKEKEEDRMDPPAEPAAVPPSGPAAAAPAGAASEPQPYAEYKEQVRRRLEQLGEDLQSVRKGLQEEFRRKSEERIRLFAQMSMADDQANKALEQKQALFARTQKEYENEIAMFEQCLKSESSLQDKILKELEEAKAQFLNASTLSLQQKELESQKQEQELERSLADMNRQIEALSRQMESDQKSWRDQIQAQEEEIVALRTQLELKETQRKGQEQRLHQDFAQARLGWQARIQALEGQLEDERRKRKDAVHQQESEIRILKLEQETKESALRAAYQKKGEEMALAKARALAKLKSLQDDLKELKSADARDLKSRQDEADKLRVELLLMDSQLKVEAEKAESALQAIRKETEGRIALLEDRIGEELRFGQKATEEKLAEIAGLEAQFAAKCRAMEDEFSRKKADMELERHELLEKFKQASQSIEKEREEHRGELAARDQTVQVLKQQMNQSAEEVRQKKEALAVEIERLKQEGAERIAALEERNRQERQKMSEVMNEKTRAVSEKKAAMMREQNHFQYALKKQEDQMVFEIQPIKNQIKDLENRLEQERYAYQKAVAAKEEVLHKLEAQKALRAGTYAMELRDLEGALKAASVEGESKAAEVRAAWLAEKDSMERAFSSLEAQAAEVEREIRALPQQAEDEKRALEERYRTEVAGLASAKQEAESRIARESEDTARQLEKYAAAEKRLTRELEVLQAGFERERQDKEQKAGKARQDQESKIRGLQEQIARERSGLESALSSARANIRSLDDELRTQQARHAEARKEVEGQWSLRKAELESRIGVLSRDFESQKAIWDKALAERSLRIEALENELRATQERQARQLGALEESRRSAERNFSESVQGMEEAHARFMTQHGGELKEREQEIAALQQELHDFLLRSREEQTRRNGEISRQRAELESRRDQLEEALQEGSRSWPESVEQKESEASALKNQMALRDGHFRSEWEKRDKDFQAFKQAADGKIEETQRRIREEKERLEASLKDTAARVLQLKQGQAQAKDRVRVEAEELEKQFQQIQSSLESQIAELEKKIVQERGRAEQQIKVKEIEISALRRDLEQKEIQRNLARESHGREIAQEMSRLGDWENALKNRLEAEREAVRKILEAKDRELTELKLKIDGEIGLIEAEKAQRKEEVRQARERLDLRVQELQIKLDQESRSQAAEIREKQRQADELSNKLQYWDENLRLEQEQDRLRWETESGEIQGRIAALESSLSGERAERDEDLRRSAEEARALEGRVRELQENHARLVGDLKRQAAEVQLEGERRENKIKEEKARMAEELRALERSLERLRVQLSLKETQAAIERQKRGREILWERRPLEAKLAELKRRWEEREKEHKKKALAQEADKERLLAEIQRLERMIAREREGRESALSEIRGQVEERLRKAREEDLGDEPGLLESKRADLAALQKALDRIDALCQSLPESDVQGLEAEIRLWESKLEPAEPDPAGDADLEGLRRSLQEKKQILPREKRRSEEAVARARQESAQVARALGKVEDESRRLRDRRAQARACLEAGISALTAQNYQEALALFHQALQLDPAFALAHQMLGLAYEKRGDKGAALAAFRKALSLDPSNDFLNRHMQELTQAKEKPHG